MKSLTRFLVYRIAKFNLCVNYAVFNASFHSFNVNVHQPSISRIPGLHSKLIAGKAFGEVTAFYDFSMLFKLWPGQWLLSILYCISPTRFVKQFDCVWGPTYFSDSRHQATVVNMPNASLNTSSSQLDSLTAVQLPFIPISLSFYYHWHLKLFVRIG